jgi:hypothetical protein
VNRRCAHHAVIPPTPTSTLREFLEIPYDQLEEMNLEAKQQRLDRVSPDKIAESA